MAEIAHEIIWLQSLLKYHGISSPSLVPMHCDNQTAIFIARNSTFHERTKHTETDCHYFQDKIMSRVISTPHVASSHQLVNVFTKSVTGISFDATCTKLGMFDLHALA